jgi:predicted ATP-binding protein involved in virulence
MKITKLELKNFKRFDDLTIDMTGLAEAPKLVLLIGTNGSGKSSVFDSFEYLNKNIRYEPYFDYLYYSKRKDLGAGVDAYGEFKDSSGNPISHLTTSNLYGGHYPKTFRTVFYGRSSIRQIPKLTRTMLGTQREVSFEDDNDRPLTLIERDSRFENDIEKITLSILNDVFKKNTTTEQIKESYINPINRAFDNIFGIDSSIGIKLTSFSPPSEGKTAEILFEKGTSTIPYDYLSSGEKEIFNILLNLLTRREYFQDTIYFLDEIDLHLNTQLQKSLLKEITENWIPDNCQLWTASHSLGFIEYANETENAAIIDLDNLNFDLPQVIISSPKNRFDVFEIAVSKEFLATIFEGKRIVFSENTDTPLYNNLKFDDTIFFNAIDKKDVFHKTKNNANYHGLIDRDYLTDKEREDLLVQYDRLHILNYYSIENYLYHPDNLDEYFNGIDKAFDKDNYINSIKTEKVAVKDKLLMGIRTARDGYPFYRENENDAKLKAFKKNDDAILEMLNSDDLETFYKIFPVKDYGKTIRERQNLNKAELAKTNWFKENIKSVL